MSNVSNRDQGAGDAITRYMADAGRYGYLTPEQESDLAVRWCEEGDREALSQLLGSHLRLVVKMARRFKGYGLPLEDLISEGHVGLMQAARRFDPSRGFRFATYAQWWIRAEMQEYVLRSWSLVKIGTTAAQKKLFFNLRRLKSQMQAYEDGDLPPETAAAIATELGVPESDVVAMNRRIASGDQSLNVSSGTDTADELMDRLIDDSLDQEALVIRQDETVRRRRLLARGLGGLSEREQQILIDRKLRDEPLTLKVLAGKHGISRERVRQIENKAFAKLQAKMQDEVRAGGL